jgi:hypothetical protein
MAASRLSFWFDELMVVGGVVGVMVVGLDDRGILSPKPGADRPPSTGVTS